MPLGYFEKDYLATHFLKGTEKVTVNWGMCCCGNAPSKQTDNLNVSHWKQSGPMRPPLLLLL